MARPGPGFVDSLMAVSAPFRGQVSA
jgi:hypothetical protein